MSCTDGVHPELLFASGSVEMLKEFKYLGSVVQCNGLADVKVRVDKATQAFGDLSFRIDRLASPLNVVST